ncbi:glutamate--cysteine ligase regulatory subunit [Phymastichus coffea]|uniref:glutamate--cysteine ligase regulatory subunit n=1 Tax=Phymastichus coffea TaxID=108790 RepID=UPI00273B407D|nr:glutamate--cysteine ligase regulatory subunit [Phymastichus coffea]XP_058801611.1 glutamate--cysteine ligase regulatory subunit [Phymastichus coffea]
MVLENNLYSTGNILLLNELKKKAGLNSRDELIEALKITLDDSQNNGESSKASNGIDINSENTDRKEQKITVKIFLSSSDTKYLKEAIDEVCKILNTNAIESLVIVLNKEENEDDILSSIQCLWTVLEEYLNNGKLISIGVSDLDTEKFIQLYNWAKVKPDIIQINLATCCVVPPALQEFTKQNDIQLLTHSDPNPILPKESLTDFFGADSQMSWAARYQIHLRCRGVLSSKGYLVRINKSK